MAPALRPHWTGFAASIAIAAMLSASAGSVPVDAASRLLDELGQSKGPLFYAACDFRVAGRDERLIWLFGTKDGAGFLFSHDRAHAETHLLRSFQLAGDGKGMTGDVAVGAWGWDLYGFGTIDGGLLTPNPTRDFRLIVPDGDFMGVILADSSVKPCETAGAK